MDRMNGQVFWVYFLGFLYIVVFCFLKVVFNIGVLMIFGFNGIYVSGIGNLSVIVLESFLMVYLEV